MSDSIHKKIFALQGQIQAITKDSLNPHFQSRYVDINSLIDELKPLLQKNGLYVLQPFAVIDGRPCLTTIIGTEDGQTIEGVITLPEEPNPQKMGSTITYFRRYALQSMLLLSTEDDDGNLAAGREQTSAPKKTMSPEQVAQFMSADTDTGEIHEATPNQKSCIKCGKPMRYVAAGMRSTGKMGKAFWGCTRECGATQPAFE